MARLGDVCEIVSGTTPKSNVPEYWDGEINWVTPAELDDDSRIVYESQRKITEQAVKDSSLKSFPAGTVLLSSRAPIGKVAIAGVEMYCNQGFKNLVCSDEIYNKYLFWFLKGKTDFLNSLGRGATFKEISKSIVENIEIPLPLIPEQKHIADILDKISDLISLRKQQLAKLDELVKVRFVEMFGDRFSNDRKWDIKLLADVADFYNGKAHEQVIDTEGKYILVTSKCIASDFAEYRTTNACLFPLHANDIVMVMSDVPNGRAIAKCELIGQDDLYTLNQRICCFRNYNMNPYFMCHLLNRHEYFLRFDDGDSQTNLRKNEILNCMLIVPPRYLQDEYADFVIQTARKKLTIQQNLDKLEELEKALMQEYFG